MAFYYVKSGGTATGDAGRAGSARTGTFASMGASAYYDSIYDVFGGGVPTTAPVDNDIVYVSDSHSKVDATPSAVLQFDIGIDCSVIAVQDADCTAYTNKTDGTGAVEGIQNNVAGNYDIRLFDKSTQIINVLLAGISIEGNRDIVFYPDVTTNYAGNIYIRDCYFKWSINGQSRLAFSGDQSSYANLYNVDLSNRYTTFGNIQVDNGVLVDIDSCSVTLDNLVYIPSNSGGIMNVRNSDLTINGEYLRNGGPDYGELNIYNCKLNSDSIPLVDVVSTRNVFVNMYGCHTGDAKYITRSYTNAGEVETDTSTYLSAIAYGTYLSYKMVSNSNPQNLKYKLITLANQDLTSDKTYSVEFTSDTPSLRKDEVWLEIERPDATDQALGVKETTNDGDPMTAASSHTTSTGAWTSPLANKYKDSLTISGMAGVSDAVVTIWVHVARNSETVYVDPAVIVE